MAKNKPTKSGGIYYNDVSLGDGFRTVNKTQGRRKGNTLTVTTTGQDYFKSPHKGDRGKITKISGESMLGTRTNVYKNGRRESSSTVFKGIPQWGMETQHNRGSGTRKTGAKKKAF